MNQRITRRGVNAGIGAALITPATAVSRAFAQSGEPIKIGFGMALTGALAGNGKADPRIHNIFVANDLAVLDNLRPLIAKTGPGKMA